MQKEFRLPSLGENVSEATVGKILVQVGDTVKKGQPILEIETDKAVAEIPSNFDGKIIQIHITVGKKVKPGELIFTYEEVAQTTKTSEPVTIPEPPKQVSEPAPTPPPSYPSPPRPSVTPPATPITSGIGRVPRPAGSPILAPPTVRRLARELGINLEEVPTMDPHGRITMEDVMAYYHEFVESKKKQAATSTMEFPITTEQAEEIPKESGEVTRDKWGPITIEPMSTIRKKTAEQMTKSWSAPQVTHFDKADITELDALREKYAGKIQSSGGRLTTIVFIMKAVVEALKRFPKFNATIDLEQEQIIYKRYYHLGIAVDTEQGLLVPVIRDVDKKTIKELAIELPQIAERARSRKISLEELQGATFTISNLGGIGGYAFTPIVNHPQVAILGVSRASIEPVYRDGKFEPRLLLPLTLSYDHRLIDGADSARFLRWLCSALENPWEIFLGL